MIDFLLEGFDAATDDEAIIWRDRVYTYGWLAAQLRAWRGRLAEWGLEPGTATAVEADFSPQAVALLLSLVDRCCVFVPLTRSVAVKRDEFLQVAEVEAIIDVGADDEARLVRRDVRATHPIYATLRARGHPGLVLFSSGSTGKSKAAVHDFTGILEKFRTPRKRQRTITFLLYDHIGGVNTLLHTLSNRGTVITVPDRSPDGVLGAIARHRAEVMPTSPTFLNLVLLSEAWKRHDLSSLRLVTYGTEPMPESTLLRFHEALPEVTLQQTYGLSEVGILRSKSRDSRSLWVKIGGEGFETRIVDGILQIHARSAMLGYLNAPSPFTEDGWFVTGDAVEVDGEYLRILGRRSELINVGGQKVYPAEVESVVQTIPGVVDAAVHGESNPLLGQIVCANIVLAVPESPREFTKRMRLYCRDRMESWKVPAKVQIIEGSLHGERFKRWRGDGSIRRDH